MTLKFEGWPSKTIGHLFYATSSIVHHFITIGEFKLELESGNAQSGSNVRLFRAVWPWNLTDNLEKQKVTSSKQHQAICIISSSFVNLTSALDFLHGPYFCHWQSLLKISWWYDNRNIVKKVWQTDRQTERSVLRAAWSQLKIHSFRHIWEKRVGCFTPLGVFPRLTLYLFWSYNCKFSHPACTQSLYLHIQPYTRFRLMLLLVHTTKTISC